MDGHERVPRVFIHEDTLFRNVSLSQIIEEASCDLVWDAADRDLCDKLEEAQPPPLDLIVLLLHADAPGLLESMARLRKRKWVAAIPILLVSSIARSELDLWQLRALGAVGLIDSNAPAEHVRFRIGQVAWKSREGRRFERAPCCIPVELQLEGEILTAYAVSLSAGGMGLACQRPIEPNTLVGLRFALEDGDDQVSVMGRTVHVREARRTGAEYEVGLFFLELPELVRTEIGLTVSRLLGTWDVVRNMDLNRADGATPEVIEGREG